MKFALANGERQEAQPDLAGECPACGSPMVARCGEIRIWHWAHKGRKHCDPWWENETDWHRAWKDQFPLECQEVVHHANDGERHIADVKTRDGWIMEFQHSHIDPDERRSREAFYKSLIWVVDGTRRQRDRAQFAITWGNGESRDPFSTKRRIPSPGGALLRDWTGSDVHVFLDFGDPQWLWWLFPHSDAVRAYVQSVSRTQFLRVHQQSCTHGPTEFDSLVENFIAFIAAYEQPPSAPRTPRVADTLLRPPRPIIRRGLRF